MHIMLLDQFPATDLPEEMSFVVHALAEQGITSVADVRIVLRAFNEDGGEYYPADASGSHDMGFELRRQPTGGNSEVSSIREIAWHLPGVSST